MMRCPTCQTWTEVLETRTRQDGTRRRRYVCANMHKFSTVERVEVVQHGGARRKKQGLNQ